MFTYYSDHHHMSVLIPSHYLWMGVKIMELIIFLVGTYCFNLITLMNSIHKGL